MIKLEMYFTLFIGIVLGLALLVAMTIVDFIYNLYELPFDTWDVVKEKYEEM